MAKRYFSRHALNIFSLEREEWEFPMHTHNFYELIFIENGSGLQLMNDVEFSYKKGDVFLLGPDDEHSFKIEEKTIFTFVKFTEQLFAEKNENNPNSKWQKKIDKLLLHPNTRPGSIVNDENERTKLFQALSLLRSEYELKDTFSRQVALELFGALITMVARNLNTRNKILKPEEMGEIDKVSGVLNYIRRHILERDKLSIGVMADTFNMSPNYIGIFIKKHTGMSVQQIVMETKLKTAERYLLNSSLTISEIAARLQFTDSSHFTKIFKKYRSRTPKAFRGTVKV